MLSSFRLCLDLVEKRNVRDWLLSCSAAALLYALCSLRWWTERVDWSVTRSISRLREIDDKITSASDPLLTTNFVVFMKLKNIFIVAIPKISVVGKFGANFHCFSASQMINRWNQCKRIAENCLLIINGYNFDNKIKVLRRFLSLFLLDKSNSWTQSNLQRGFNKTLKDACQKKVKWNAYILSCSNN